MTAKQAYQQRREEIDRQIEKLQVQLAALDDVQADHEDNWAFVGDAGNILEQLRDIHIIPDFHTE